MKKDQLPEKIFKLLSSSIEDDKYIGMELALDYADTVEEYGQIMMKAVREGAAGISGLCIWSEYFRDNKEGGNNEEKV